MNTKVKSITLLLGKKEIELTPEECKELKAALDDLYPSPEKIVKEVHHHDWWNYPRSPYYYSLKVGGGPEFTSTGINFEHKSSNDFNTVCNSYRENAEKFLALKCNY